LITVGKNTTDHVSSGPNYHVLDLKKFPLNIVAVFFSVVSKMVSNINIFQGIVSKLEILVS